MSSGYDRQRILLAGPDGVLAYLNQPPLDHEISGISGNATAEAKALTVRLQSLLHQPRGFHISVANQVKVSDVSILDKFDEPGGPKEAKVVCEFTVTQDMMDSNGNLHNGIIYILMDECTMLPMALLDFMQGRDGKATGAINPPGFSRAINNVLHNTAQVGTKLRIVNSSASVGVQTMSSRCEIWDETNHHLVASGTQLAMQPVRKARL